MKTTINLADSHLVRAKIAAARRRTTLGNLVIEGLERVMTSPSGGSRVTDSMIEEMRKKEGI